jgi:hypothetical protein
MHRFDRMHLTPDVALDRLDTVDLEEKSRVAEAIALIAVIDHRRDFLAAGYSCMRDYCTSRLHMSEDQAFRRIQVARAARLVPEVFEYLADGRLSLATASVLAPHLQPETAAELLKLSAFQCRDEILRRIAERSRAVVVSPPDADGTPTVETSSGSHCPGASERTLGPVCDSSPGRRGVIACPNECGQPPSWPAYHLLDRRSRGPAFTHGRGARRPAPGARPARPCGAVR